MTVMGDGPVSNRVHEPTLIGKKEREGRGQREENLKFLLPRRKLLLTKKC